MARSLNKRPKGRASALLALLLFLGVGVWMGGQYWARKWRGVGRFTLIGLENGVLIESLDPVNGWGVRMILPDELEVETVGGRGRWKAGNLRRGGDKFGTRWAADSVADYLGVGYIAVRGEMTAWDWISWWWLGRTVKWQEIDLERRGWVEEAVAVDGEKLVKLGPEWPGEARTWFVSSELAQEALSVTVVNTTDISGLGTHAARALESAGIRVGMIKSDTEAIADKCVVRASEENLKSRGVAWIVGTHGCRTELVGEGSQAAETLVFFGREYEKWWLGQ